MPKPKKPKRNSKVGEIKLNLISKQTIIFNRLNVGTPRVGDRVESLSEFEKRMSPLEKEIFRKKINHKL